MGDGTMDAPNKGRRRSVQKGLRVKSSPGVGACEAGEQEEMGVLAKASYPGNGQVVDPAITANVPVHT
jgi:hypothetical protein